MADDTETVVRAVYDAWRVKDIEAVAARFAGDACFDIHISASVHPLGGPCHGKGEVLARLEKIIEGFDFLSYVVPDLIVSGERAAAQPHIRYLHKASGERLESTLAHFWLVRGGLVVRLDEYHDMGAVEAFAARTVAPI